MTVYKSARFKETSLPGESEGDFRNRLSVAAREERDAAVEKLRVKFAAKHATLQERIRKAEQAVSREAEQARGAKVQTAISLGSSILGAVPRPPQERSPARPACCAASGARSTRPATPPARRTTVAALQAQNAELDREFTAATQELDRHVRSGRGAARDGRRCGPRRPTSTSASWRWPSRRTGSTRAAH